MLGSTMPGFTHFNIHIGLHNKKSQNAWYDMQLEYSISESLTTICIYIDLDILIDNCVYKGSQG